MSFATLRSRHYTNNVFDTDRFAETVTVKDDSGNSYSVAAVVRRRDFPVEDDVGGIALREEVAATILRSDLPSKPSLKWRLLLSGDDQAYMFSLEQSINDHVYVARFSRDKHVAARPRT